MIAGGSSIPLRSDCLTPDPASRPDGRLAIARCAAGPRRRAVLRLLRQPTTWALLVTVVIVAAIAVGAALSLLVGVGVLAIGALATTSRWVDRTLEAADRKRQLALRRDRRTARLSRRSIPTAPLDELTGIVDTIAQTTPSAVELFALEELLDYYVRVALSRDRATVGLMRDARATIGLGPPTCTSPLGEALQKRRRETEAAIQTHMRACDDELSTIECFVRLLALRTTLEAGSPAIAADAVPERLLQVGAEDDVAQACDELAGT